MREDTLVTRALLTRPACLSITVADAVCDTVEVSAPLRCARYASPRCCVLNVLCAPQGVRTQMPSLFVRSRLVRYIHLPETLDPGSAIESHRRKLVDAQLHYARKGTGALPRRAAGGTEAAAQHGGIEEDADADDTEET